MLTFHKRGPEDRCRDSPGKSVGPAYVTRNIGKAFWSGPGRHNIGTNNRRGASMLQERLRAIPLLRDLPAAALGAIEDRLSLEAFERGTIVFREGDSADVMYVV